MPLKAHRLDHSSKSTQECSGLAIQMRHRRIETKSLLGRPILQGLNTARTDPTGREIHDTQKRGVIVGVFHQTQISQCVLNLGTLEESKAAKHSVGNTGVEQCVFNHAGLGIATIENGNFTSRKSLANQIANLID